MKTNFLKTILPAILVIVLAGCSAVKVSTDYDKKADFTKYKTFNFSKGIDKVSMNELNRRRLKDAITVEMNAKGYQVASSPDVLINVFLKGQINYTATATTNYNGGPFMYSYWGGGFGSSNTYVDVNKDIEGTLFIDVIDVQDKKLVWEGVAEGLMNPRTETREEGLNKVIKMVFQNYPK